MTYYKPEVHDNLIQEYQFEIKDLGTPRFKRFALKGIGTGLINRIGNRLSKLLFEYPDIEIYFKVKKALKYESGYDLLISIAVPHPIHWGVASVYSKKIAKTWIADCGDPYMGSRLDTFRKMFYFSYFERSFCRKATYIAVPIEGAKSAYYSEFREKIVVIPQGFKFEETLELKSIYQPNTPIQFIFAGNFIPGRRDPRPLLDLLVDCKLPFRFEVYTKTPLLLNPYKEKLKNQLQVSDFIPRKELIPKLSQSDFLLNLENGVAEQLPSKLIDYYLAGRPVLSIDSNNFDGEKVLAFLKRDFKEALVFEDMERFQIEEVTKQFTQLA